jgi:abortive infection bacteriophage resistance protein
MQAQPWRLFFGQKGLHMVTAALLPYGKPALSYAQQVAQLVARGMAVSEPLAAEAFLSKTSYYRLSAYWYPFRLRNADGSVQDAFEAGTSLDHVIQLYEFDRELRLLVLDALERVEVAVRTAVTHELAMTHGAFGHEVAAHFHPQFNHAVWLNKLRTETGRSTDAFVDHFQSRYSDYPALPIWMCTEVVSIGALSLLYKGMQNKDKAAVAATFGMHPKRLQDWLHVLSYVRNVCAHHSRLWNRELAIKPRSMPEPEWNAPLLPSNSRLFCVLLMLTILLNKSGGSLAWRGQCTGLLRRLATAPRWRAAMGLPSQWEEHPLWK